jgi:hypothetical protein
VTETAPPPSWQGSVILDIGNGVGALVLHTSAEWLDHEIDLAPDDPTLVNTHSAVRERLSPEGSSYAAVYPQLHEGEYTIVGSTQRLIITGGRVTDIELTEPYAPLHHPHH